MKRPGEVLDTSLPRLRSHRRIDFAIIGVLLLALGLSLFGPEMESPAGEDQPIRSIAVLPLANLSGDPDQEYSSDGMTEALIADLAKIGSLRVISRTSAMRYQQTDLSMPEIAADLGVEGLIEGSVLSKLVDSRHAGSLPRSFCGLEPRARWADPRGGGPSSKGRRAARDPG